MAAEGEIRQQTNWIFVTKSTHNAPRLGVPCEPKPRTHVVNQAGDVANGGGVVTVESTKPPIECTRKPKEMGGITASATDEAANRAHTGSDDAYSSSYPVPGSKKGNRRYPLAKVECGNWDQQVYNDRFRFVSGELKKMVDSHPELRDHARSINYCLEMVGTAPDKAQASIVVFCLKEDFKNLRTLFKEHAQKRLYCHEGERSRWLSTSWDKPTDPPVAPFQLIYFVTTTPLVRNSSTEPLTAHFKTDLTWCGGTVRCQTRTATLGISINIDTSYGILTVEHLFHPEATETDTNLADDLHHATSSAPDPSALDMGCLRSWVCEEDEDDYSFEESTEDDTGSAPVALVSLAGEIPSTCEPAQQWERIQSPLGLDYSSPYLDWALTRPNNPSISTPRDNMFFARGLSAVVLDRVAEEPRYHRAPVYMISGIRGILLGQILTTSIMIGSLPGQELCEAWTLILDSFSELVSGECGSIIVDQETHEVYGHVIGSGPAGHVYLVPLRLVFEQIGTCFGTNCVGISVSPMASATVRETGGSPQADQTSESFVNVHVSRPNQLRQMSTSPRSPTFPDEPVAQPHASTRHTELDPANKSNSESGVEATKFTAASESRRSRAFMAPTYAKPPVYPSKLDIDGTSLPNEPAPEAMDYVWDYQWDSASPTWFFATLFRGETRWDSRRVPSSTASSSETYSNISCCTSATSTCTGGNGKSNGAMLDWWDSWDNPTELFYATGATVRGVMWGIKGIAKFEALFNS
ncbi:hypothetical protein ACJZ2D_002043 [Fusarium nematophilum]